MIFSSENIIIGRRRLILRWSWTYEISSVATLKEREQIEDMISSTFSDLDHIDSEGVNHVMVEYSMIDKL